MGAPKSATKKKVKKKIAAPRPAARMAAAQAVAVPVVAPAKPLPQIAAPTHGAVVAADVVTFTLTTNNLALNHFLVILDANGTIFDPPGPIAVDFSNGSPVDLDIDFTGIAAGTAYTFRLVSEHPAGRTSHEIDVTVGP